MSSWPYNQRQKRKYGRSYLSALSSFDRFVARQKAFLNLQDFPGYTSVRPCLVRHVSTVVPYACHVFADAKGRRLVVRRKEIAFFSHCWDLPPDQVGSKYT